MFGIFRKKQPKLSEILTAMADTILVGPDPAAEATTAALLFAQEAWNRAIGVGLDKNWFRPILKELEAENRHFWRDLESRKPGTLIGKLVAYKLANHPDDRRIILGVRSGGGKVKVVWGDLDDPPPPPTAPRSCRRSPA